MWLGDEQFSQHCENLELTPSVDIPLHDPDALDLNPGLEWLFDKKTLEEFAPDIRYIEVQKQPDTIALAKKQLQSERVKIKFIREVYSTFASIWK